MTPSYFMFHGFRDWLSRRSLNVQGRCNALKNEDGTDNQDIATVRKKWSDFSSHIHSSYWPQGKGERNLQSGLRPLLTGPKYGNMPTTLINLTTGLLDLKLGRLRPHNESKDGRNRPISVIDSQLSEALASGDDAGTMRYLQTILGAALGGGIRRKFVWLCGPGGTGKSTFLNVIQAVLGPLYGTLEYADVVRQKRQGANHFLSGI